MNKSLLLTLVLVVCYAINVMSQNNIANSFTATSEYNTSIARFDHTNNGNLYFQVQLSKLNSDFERYYFYVLSGEKQIFITDKSDYSADSALFYIHLNSVESSESLFRHIYNSCEVAEKTFSPTLKQDFLKKSPFLKEEIYPNSYFTNNDSPEGEGAEVPCSSADVACSANTYSFPSGTSGTATVPVGGYPNYDCLNSQPCPAWYYMQLSLIHISEPTRPY
jgi:hypothetical protein